MSDPGWVSVSDLLEVEAERDVRHDASRFHRDGTLEQVTPEAFKALKTAPARRRPRPKPVLQEVHLTIQQRRDLRLERLRRGDLYHEIAAAEGVTVQTIAEFAIRHGLSRYDRAEMA